jgi:hypothetical protein
MNNDTGDKQALRKWRTVLHQLPGCRMEAKDLCGCIAAE